MSRLTRFFSNFVKQNAPEQSGRKRMNFFSFGGGFDAAKKNRLTDDWSPGNQSPTSIFRMDGSFLRERARDLVLNNPLARSGVNAYINNVIECGIQPKPKIEDMDQRKSWVDAWDHFAANEADITGIQHLHELAALWLEEVIVGGGCLMRKRVLPRRSMQGRRLRAAIELFPEERFADDKDTFIQHNNNRKSSNPITGGIELDAATGRPVRYWVKPFHPNDSSTNGSLAGHDPVPLEASECRYAYFRKRIGEYRGHTLMHSAILWLWKLGYFTDNELMASALKSCFAAAIKSNDDFGDLFNSSPDGSLIDVNGNTLEKLEPGIIARLRPGEEIEGVGPNVPGGDSMPWIMLIQRSIAVGMDLSYEETVRDYSQGSFSSTRASANSDRKRFRRMQKFAINHFYQPVNEHFVRWSSNAGTEGFPLPAELVANFDDFVNVSWRSPGWMSVNPKDDAMANHIRIGDKTTTRDAVIAAEGGDSEETFQQLGREAELITDLGADALDENVVAAALNDNPSGGSDGR